MEGEQTQDEPERCGFEKEKRDEGRQDIGCRKKVNMGKEGERMSQKGTAQVRMCATQIHCGEDEVVI